MLRGASHGIPNPVRLTKSLAVTSLPLGGGEDPLGGCGIGGSPRLQEPVSAVPRCRPKEPRHSLGLGSLRSLLYQAAPLHREQARLGWGGLFLGQDKALLK